MADHQEYDNLPTIQIITYIRETLAEYYKKVKRQDKDLFDVLDMELPIHNHCPLCGGSGCARFIGYYEREVIDEHGVFYNAFPIARYICRGKGKEKGIGHKTFSLLPYQLVPYTRYSIAFIIKALTLLYKDHMSVYKLQDYLAGFGKGEILSITATQVFRFKQLIMEAIDKIMAIGFFKELDEAAYNDRPAHFIEYAEGFECTKIEPSIRGPCAISYDFYLQGGGYFRNAHFLFGTPSQFRAHL